MVIKWCEFKYDEFGKENLSCSKHRKILLNHMDFPCAVFLIGLFRNLSNI